MASNHLLALADRLMGKHPTALDPAERRVLTHMQERRPVAPHEDQGPAVPDGEGDDQHSTDELAR